MLPSRQVSNKLCCWEWGYTRSNHLDHYHDPSARWCHSGAWSWTRMFGSGLLTLSSLSGDPLASSRSSTSLTAKYTRMRVQIKQLASKMTVERPATFSSPVCSALYSPDCQPLTAHDSPSRWPSEDSQVKSKSKWDVLNRQDVESGRSSLPRSP